VERDIKCIEIDERVDKCSSMRCDAYCIMYTAAIVYPAVQSMVIDFRQ